MQNFLNEPSSVQDGVNTDEMSMIDRAELALKLYLNMSESAAHLYIERRAQDMRSTKKEIAKNILKTYEP